MKKIAVLLTLAIAAIACQKEEPVIPKIEFSDPEATYTIPSEGGTATVGFSANVNWTATIKDAENTTWCTISPSSGNAGEAKVNVLAEKNENNDNREMTLIINAGNVVKEVKVTQLQKDALLLEGEKSYEFPMEGGEISLVINHNVDYELQLPEWIVRQPELKGMVKDDIKLKVNAQPQDGEERTGTITIKNLVKNIEISVKQAAWTPIFEINDAVLEIPNEGGKATFNINANIAFNVTAADAAWGTLTNTGNAYTFEAKGVNTNFDKNTVKINVTPEDEKYAESAQELTITQKGKANLLWSCNPVGGIADYTTGHMSRLCKYGDYILFSNMTKIYVLAPKTGEIVKTFTLPEGMTAEELMTDDNGNILISASAKYQTIMTIYLVESIENAKVTELIKYNTGNYYCVDTGNVRVKGDVRKDAMITATIASGAICYWEIKNGVPSDWKWCNAPYNVNSCIYGCALPGGATVNDGIYFIGYGGDYNLKYLSTPVKGDKNTWIQSCVSGGTWMENWNCMSTAEFNGKKYLAAVMGCMFNYDATDVVIFDVTDPANGQLVYKLPCDLMVKRAEDWTNLDWVGKGAFSDVLLTVDKDVMYLYFSDTNYNVLGGVEITK